MDNKQKQELLEQASRTINNLVCKILSEYVNKSEKVICALFDCVCTVAWCDGAMCFFYRKHCNILPMCWLDRFFKWFILG